MITARADVVGSLLRPAELLRAREALDAGRIAPAELRAVEDRAVAQAVALQEESGLEVVTDGEMRRLSFQSQVTDAISGFGEWDLRAFLWGEWRSEELGPMTIERPPIAVLEPLRRRRSLAAEEFAFVRGRTDRAVKVTIPSPSLFANFWDPARSRRAYRSAEAFLRAVAEFLREDVDELVRLGCTYLQLDAPHYTLFLDPGYREFYARRGRPAEQWLDFAIELDNFVIGERPGVTFAFHLCRGNQRSRWLVQGGYEPIASRVFGGIKAERLMLEYDDARSGSFSALEAVPESKVAVLGLVTTKSPRRETVSDLRARVLEASRHCPLDRLAISPQCGFASSVEGNALGVDDQSVKLRTLVETARSLWG